MAAVLEPAGSGVAGVQVKGVTAQYQADGISGVAEAPNSTGIHPYDSGTILGHVNPGQVGEKLVSGVVQRSSQLKVDGTAGVTGNALVPTYGVGVVPVVPTGSHAVDGLSQAPQHE
jgi:hypothetical protein